VTATRPAVVLLKATFDPRWTTTVDGLRVAPVMIAPSLVGVQVPAGRHVVEFRYDPVEHYPLLLGVGLLTLLTLVLVPRRARLRTLGARTTASAGSRSETVGDPPLTGDG